MTTASHPRITPNLFGIAFGLTGLGEAWATAARLYGVPAGIADALLLTAAVVWVALLGLYAEDLARSGRWRAELRDPLFAPFTALIAIVAMLLGVELAGHGHSAFHSAGVAVATAAIVVTVLLGGTLIGQWIVEDLALVQWHPGYFIPTVAGGYLRAESLADLGHHDLALVLFGYGSVSWLVLGSILLQRMFVEPRLPGPLLPTMAIQMAPPVVAGTAWFAINGERADGLALALAGYALLMVLVQLRLVPVYRTAPFGPGWWAFSFSYAAVVIDAIHWLPVADVQHGAVWAWLLLAATTAAIGALATRTLIAVRTGRFLPAPAPPAVPVSKEHAA